MAFHTLSHELSLPHFPQNLQTSGSPRYPERSTLLQPNQDGLRQMLHKDGRGQMSDLSESDHLSHRALDGGDCVLQGRPHHAASAAAAANAEANKDCKYLDEKVSLLSDANDLKSGAPPTWLSSALLRQQSASFVEGEESRKWCGCDPGSQCVRCSFLHLQPHPAAAASNTSIRNAGACTQWLSTPMGMVNKVQHPGATTPSPADLVGQEVPGESMRALSTQQSHGSADINHNSPVHSRGLLDLHSDTANSSDLVDEDTGDHDHHNIWQAAKLKADILSHPLYEQLLAAHVDCLRIATPVDQLPRIDAQLAQSQHIATKYSVLAGHNQLLGSDEKDELDQFMTNYTLLLCSFREQLQQHVRVHAMEAVMACWELEQSLLTLTGVSPGDGTGATMSDDDDDQAESDPGIYDSGLEMHDGGAFGPLIPTETERSLMERVRQELKSELKQGYRDRIVDVREEILRKRRAGKLPGDTTSVLKAWWQAHAKWPYPTEDEKARLVQETGLQLKQINNWFINQRKRNWHSNPSTSSALKNKRKR